MGLKEYRDKRDLARTPEPAGGELDPSSHGRFVVQKHQARRLHYDLRLEIRGSLKCWAVPKGPSLNPTVKRLAARTEDHPVEYLDFEKVIPQGNYGAGTMIVWDMGDFTSEGDLSAAAQIERGELKFRLHGSKLGGSWVLVKTKSPSSRKSSGEEWLLIKHQDAAADPDWRIDDDLESALSGRTIEEVRDGDPPSGASRGGAAALEGAEPAALPSDLAPMLATLGDKPFTHPDWVYELKWDGVRVLAVVEHGQLRLISRNGRDVTAHYPELAGLPDALRARTAVLDGEIVVLDEQGRSDFGRLQSRMHVERPSPALLRDTPVVAYFFDLPYCDGYDLRSATLLARKSLLKDLLNANGPIRYCDHVAEAGEQLFGLARDHGAEGVVAKRADSAYVFGRSRDWLKIKAVREIDVVIGGFTGPRGGREHLGAIQVGVYGPDGLRFLGGVGSGFTSESLSALAAGLMAIKSDRCPFLIEPKTKELSRWVLPELIARVSYSGWTRDGRLRHPVFRGLRDDVDAADCVLEEDRAETKPPVVHAPAIEGIPVLRERKEIEQELFNGKRESVRIEIGGKSVRLTHLNKIYFPEPGYAKRDLLAYYYGVADSILPFLRDRPLVLHRFPNGIESSSFYQKDCGEGVPDWMDLAVIPSEGSGRDIRYFVANDLPALLYLVNLGAIEMHPWSSRTDDLESPDYVFFDLDPTEETPFSTVVSVARRVLKTLNDLDLRPFLKTSGASGMHLYLPLERDYSYEQARAFAEIVARVVLAKMPNETTIERMTDKRGPGKIYLDYSQNAYSRPLAAVYSVRPYPLATVGAPVAAAELRQTLTPDRFGIKTMPDRLMRKGDLWSTFWASRSRIESALAELGQYLTTQKNHR